ncbi:MAG: hypothetical protein E6R03_03765 [Hyphomicrobiaceae bacterium]|nr:MAG: hypothetical protein E6R03_03765 [Hyphomicrobiaceae bacterium]
MSKKNHPVRQNRDRVADLIGTTVTSKTADLLLSRTSRLLKLLAKANSVSAHSELGVELERDECMLVVKFPLDQWDEVSSAFGSCSRLRKTLKRVVK